MIWRGDNTETSNTGVYLYQVGKEGDRSERENRNIKHVLLSRWLYQTISLNLCECVCTRVHKNIMLILFEMHKYFKDLFDFREHCGALGAAHWGVCINNLLHVPLIPISRAEKCKVNKTLFGRLLSHPPPPKKSLWMKEDGSQRHILDSNHWHWKMEKSRDVHIYLFLLWISDYAMQLTLKEVTSMTVRFL